MEYKYLIGSSDYEDSSKAVELFHRNLYSKEEIKNFIRKIIFLMDLDSAVNKFGGKVKWMDELMDLVVEQLKSKYGFYTAQPIKIQEIFLPKGFSHVHLDEKDSDEDVEFIRNVIKSKL